MKKLIVINENLSQFTTEEFSRDQKVQKQK